MFKPVHDRNAYLLALLLACIAAIQPGTLSAVVEALTLAAWLTEQRPPRGMA